MLSDAYFLAKFRFDTAENEPAKNLQNFRKMHFRKMHFRKMHFSKMHFRNMHFNGASIQLGKAASALSCVRGERPAGIRSKFLAKRPQSGGQPL